VRQFFQRLGSDGVVALVFLLLTLVAYVDTLSFRAAAAKWPHWILLALAILNGLLILVNLLTRGDQNDE